MNVAILGASTNPDRYANKAQRLLVEHGHHVIPVTPNYPEVLGEPARASLGDIDQPVDTVTLYVGPARQDALLEPLLALRPRRVIFNPGTENTPIEQALEQAGIQTLRACTLVLLRTGQFAPSASDSRPEPA